MSIGVIDAIAPNDSKERFTGLGVRVIEGEARFRDTPTVVVGPGGDIKFEIKARRFVIATGSLPAVPPISGLDQTAYLTNETVFETRERPKHLIVIGGGPVGLELAQAFRRLGSEVTVLELAQPLAKEDPECAAIVLDALAREGVTVRSGVKVERVRRLRQRIEVVLAGDTEETIQGTELLIAAGRRPNIDGPRSRRRPHQARARTASWSTSASAPATSASTPSATSSGRRSSPTPPTMQAAQLVRHLLFRLPVKMNADEIPRVTFTEPELAHVGLTDAEARERHGAIRVLRWPYHENDRAQAEARDPRPYQGGDRQKGADPRRNHRRRGGRRADHRLDARDQPRPQYPGFCRARGALSDLFGDRQARRDDLLYAAFDEFLAAAHPWLSAPVWLTAAIRR